MKPAGNSKLQVMANLTGEQLARAKKAAWRWQYRDGNNWVSSKFDRQDAEQEACIYLLTKPEASTTELQQRIVDAVRVLVPGYRQGNMLELSMSNCNESVEVADNAHAAYQSYQLKQNLRYIRADPRRQQLAELILAGNTVTETGKLLGVSAVRISQRLIALQQELLDLKPRVTNGNSNIQDSSQ
jgi:hypothetical protein